MLSDLALREEGPPDTLDNTMRTGWDSCRRSLYWFLRGYDYKFTPPYFVFGQVWQEMLNVWYTGREDLDWANPEVIYLHGQKCREFGKKLWADSGCVGAKNDTLENLLSIWDYYVVTFPNEPFEIVEGGVEQGWEWPLKGTPYMLAGSLDGYIFWPGYGFLVLENKTTGVWLTDSFIGQWTHSTQVSQYIWYLTRMKGEEVFGCYMNMTTKRKKKTAPEGLFARSLEKRSEFRLQNFERGILDVFSDMEREWDRWHWTKTSNPINCKGGIGKSPCLYQQVCLAEMDFTKVDPLQFEGITTREGKWEPWKRGGTARG
jgi:hypothetical protein